MHLTMFRSGRALLLVFTQACSRKVIERRVFHIDVWQCAAGRRTLAGDGCARMQGILINEGIILAAAGVKTRLLSREDIIRLMKNVLVTGGAGFFCSNFLRYILQAD